nr:MAG TPA: hypothetical protein [Caudoviricetes sp.]
MLSQDEESPLINEDQGAFFSIMQQSALADTHARC